MLTVRLDNTIEKQLNFTAKEKHVPKSTIVKEALVWNDPQILDTFLFYN